MGLFGESISYFAGKKEFKTLKAAENSARKQGIKRVKKVTFDNFIQGRR